MSTYDSDTPEAKVITIIKSLQKALADERASKGDVLLKLSAAHDQLVEAERHLEWWAHECDKLDEELSKLRLQYQRARTSAWASGIVAVYFALETRIWDLVGY